MEAGVTELIGTPAPTASNTEVHVTPPAVRPQLVSPVSSGQHSSSWVTTGAEQLEPIGQDALLPGELFPGEGFVEGYAEGPESEPVALEI